MAELLSQQYPRIAGSLLDLYENSENLTEENPEFEPPTSLPVKNPILNMDESGTKVIVKITTTDIKTLLPELEKLGFEMLGSAPELYFVEGYIPVDNIPKLQPLESQGLMGAMPVYTPINNVGAANSQATFVHETDRVRASLPTGFNGTGVRVGVMSDSYNVSNNGSAPADISSGDLPTGITVLQEGPSGSSDEGRAMLQLIHDLAPGANLAFSSVFFGELDFAQQIINLANPTLGNAQVLVDDVGYFAEPFFQDGVIAQAVDNVVTNRGVTYFSSAGNSSRQAYESTNFNAVSDTTLNTILNSPAGSLYYDFDLGVGTDTRQRITLSNGQIFTPSLQWDDPFYTTNGVDTNLDIFLLNASNNVVASSADNNILNQTPVEILDYRNNTGSTQNYDVVIRLTAGPAPGRIKYVNFGNNLSTAEYPLNAPTVDGHPAAVNARAVAAVPYFDQTTAELFTSQGPSTILFEPNGIRKATPEVRQKPDFAAIDGTDTTFFGSRDFDGTGFPNFFGTSAAAPHAAAIAALIKQAKPNATPANIYNRLESTAKDIGAPGFDIVTGFGLVNAYDAIFRTVTPAPVNFTDNFEDGDLPLAYETNSNGAGRIQVTTQNNPIGTRHVTLDSIVGTNLNSLNELILHVNTTGFNNIQLSFDQKEFEDEDDPMPATFTGSVNADGVALSVDGTNWYRLISLTGTNSTNTYQTRTFDLSTFATSNNLTLGSDVRIKFQQYDNFPITTDGFAFDNISVSTVGIPAPINGTPGQDNLIGTNANDKITGFQGADTLTGGLGNDEFIYTNIRDAGDTITDFVAGTDKIVLTSLFASLNLGSLNYSTATSGGYLSFGTQGSDSIVLIDRDGSAGLGRPTPLITVTGISNSTLNNSNNFII
jgi:hypothetical protein